MKKGNRNKITIKKGGCLLLSILLVLATLIITPAATGDKQRGDPWSVTLNFEDSVCGSKDTAIFAGHSSASDGQDIYDIPKAGYPPAPYMYAWFDAGLDEPYDYLWTDCKHYPGDQKTWYLNVTCDASCPPTRGTTNITISWDSDKVNESEYTHHVELWNDTQKVADMKTETQYILQNAESGSTYAFQIRCQVNRAPVAVDDYIVVAEGGTATLLTNSDDSVLDNDTDADLDSLTAIKVSDPSNGVLTLNSNGTFSYTHDGGETVSDSFTYMANDSTVDSNVATVYITISGVNDPPVAVDDYIVVAEGGTATLLTNSDDSVLDNDTDADLDSLTAIKVSDPSNGVLTLNSNGTFSYTHDGGETVSDSFTYMANDSTVDSNVATVYITISGVNDPPVNTVPGPQTINQDTDLIFNSTNGNLISIVDIDAGGNDVEVNLTAINGVMNLSSTAGLTFSDGDGTEDVTMEFTGTIIDINGALDGLKFIPTTGYYGPASVAITTDDQGYAGAGGAQSDTDIVDITVLKLHHLYLRPHWNLVSIPFNESVLREDIVVVNGTEEYSWTDAYYAGIIIHHIYDWNRTGQNYYPTNVDTLEPGRGYWMWAYYDCELLLASNEVGDGYITDLEVKWNIMGQPYNTTLAKDDLIVHYNVTEYSWENATGTNNEEGEPLILGFIYGYNRIMQMHELSDDFVPTYGYWMYAFYECTLKREAS